METGMNILQFGVITYLLAWDVTSHDSLTVVHMLKLTILSLKINFDKTHENVKDFLSEDC